MLKRGAHVGNSNGFIVNKCYYVLSKFSFKYYLFFGFIKIAANVSLQVFYAKYLFFSHAAQLAGWGAQVACRK